MHATTVSGPLSNHLVVSLEQAVAAPACTVRLADAGARVIKIERNTGETARHYDHSVKGTSAYFAWLNRGKESATLDLKDGEDRQLVEAMLSEADVFVQNFAPGAMARLGLGARDVVARHPGIIAVDIVGYGQDTPGRDLRAYDLLVQAEAGICAVTGTTESPCKVGVSIADVGTGMNAHAAILEALLERTATGKGQAIEISMFDSMADWMSVPLLHWLEQGRETPRAGLAHASIYPYAPFSCRDGSVLIAVQNNGEWSRFCREVLSQPHLIDDSRFATNTNRVAHRDALAAIISEWFAPKCVAEVLEALEGAHIAYGRVSSISDLAAHPSLRLVDARVPGGKFRAVASPLRPHQPQRAVPGIGEHTGALRTEFAAGSKL